MGSWVGFRQFLKEIGAFQKNGFVEIEGIGVQGGHAAQSKEEKQTR